MNVRRAIIIGLLLWIAALIIGLILFFITRNTSLSDTFLSIIGLIFLVVLTAIASFVYFGGKKKVEINPKEGLLLGGVFFIVSVVLDTITFIPFVSVAGSSVSLLAYYISPAFLIGLILILAVPSLVGYIARSKARKKHRK